MNEREELERLRGENALLHNALRCANFWIDGHHSDCCSVEECDCEAALPLDVIRKALASSELSALYAAVVAAAIRVQETDRQFHAAIGSYHPEDAGKYDQEYERSINVLIDAVDALRVARGVCEV